MRYFHAGKIAASVGAMIRSPQRIKRRLRESFELFYFLHERRGAAH